MMFLWSTTDPKTRLPRWFHSGKHARPEEYDTFRSQNQVSAEVVRKPRKSPVAKYSCFWTTTPRHARRGLPSTTDCFNATQRVKSQGGRSNSPGKRRDLVG